MNNFIAELVEIFKTLDIEKLGKREALTLLHKIQIDLFKAVISKE